MKYLANEEDPEDQVNYRKKYMTWHAMAFTDHNKNMKTCPNVKNNCELIIEKGDYTLINTVECDCGSKFCFGCNNESHDPASCAHVQKWMEKETGGDADNI